MYIYVYICIYIYIYTSVCTGIYIHINLEKVGMEVLTKDIDTCHRVGKQDRLIVKSFRRKDCQQVLRVK